MKITNQMRGQEVGITHAVLLHGSRSPNNSASRFATLHDVADGGEGRPVIGAGVVAGKAMLERVMADLTGRSSLEFFDSNILALSANAVVWWRKPAPARVWFNTRGDCVLKGRTGVTPQPGLVFAATESSWFVWAVKGSERPGKDTALFRAPYMNVWESGKICTGQAELPRGIGTQVCAGYEEAFWSSRFTHPNIHESNRLVTWPGGITKLWDELLKGDHAEFPQDSLVPFKTTIDLILGKIAKE